MPQRNCSRDVQLIQRLSFLYSILYVCSYFSPPATLATYSEIRLKWHNCKVPHTYTYTSTAQPPPLPHSTQPPPTTFPLKSLIHCLAARNQNSLGTLKSSKLLHFRTAAAHSTEVVNKVPVVFPPPPHTSPLTTTLKKKLALIDLTLQQKFAEQVLKLVELGNGMRMAQATV